MEELAGFFSGLGRRGRLLILLVPGLAYAYSLALYAVFVYPRAVDAGIAPGQGELLFALALFAAFWGGQIFDVKVSLAKLMKGECENLERLSVKGAKSKLNIKLGHFTGLEPELAEVVECALDAGVELCASASGLLAEVDTRPQLCRDQARKLFHRRRITQVPA